MTLRGKMSKACNSGTEENVSGVKVLSGESLGNTDLGQKKKDDIF